MRDGAVSSIVFVAIFLLFAMTSAPGLGLIDSGELTTAAATLSIAHPTGYPLYVLLGRLWIAVMPFAADRAMVLFSCATSAAALTILFSIARHALRSHSLLPPFDQLAALFLTLACACTATVWQSVAFAEVYPLSFLLAALLVLIGYNIALARIPQSETVRWCLIAMFLWGLSLGNHLTIIWFAPFTLYIAWLVIRDSLEPRRVLFWCLLAIGAGTSVNLYLPIRSAAEPLLDWGNPETFDGLLRHLSAWQFRVWMFTADISTLLGRLWDYLRSLSESITLPQLFFLAVGLLSLLTHRTWFPLTLLASWVVGAFYNLNYDIPDIHTYDLIFYPLLFYFVLSGITFLLSHLQSTAFARRSGLLTTVLAVFIFSTAAFTNLSKADSSKNRFARSFTTELLNSLPDSAVVLQGNWDIQSPAIYLQGVEQLRTDITLLDLNLMQRSWYIAEQARLHPELFDVCRPVVDDFLFEVAKFEQGGNYDGQTLEDAFVDLNNCIIDNARLHRPVYIRDTKIVDHPAVGAGFPMAATGYFIRVLRDSTESPKSLEILNPENIYFNPIPEPGEARLREESALSMIAAGERAYKTRQIAIAESASVSAGHFDPSNIALKYLNRNIDIAKTRRPQENQP